MVEKILFKLRQSFELCRSLKRLQRTAGKWNPRKPKPFAPKQKTRQLLKTIGFCF
jgi:hypothetical protein